LAEASESRPNESIDRGEAGAHSLAPVLGGEGGGEEIARRAPQVADTRPANNAALSSHACR